MVPVPTVEEDAMRAKHRCPGCQVVDVPNKMLACLLCWRKLPAAIQREVLATFQYPMMHPRRATVLQQAVDHWRMLRDA